MHNLCVIALDKTITAVYNDYTVLNIFRDKLDIIKARGGICLLKS